MMIRVYLFLLSFLIVALGSVAGAHSPLREKKAPAGAASGTSDIYSIGTKWTTAKGEAFKLSQLKGKKSVITLFYTSCRTICPMTVDHIKAVESALGDKAKDVRFVMVTIDPQNDKVTELKKFSDQHNVGNWTFLAGTEAETRQLAADLTLGYGDKPGNEKLHQMHSLAFAVISESGKVLGTLPTMNPDIAKAQALLR